MDAGKQMEDLIKRAGEIFCDAVDLESQDERDRYVERVCAGDESLRSAVRELLEGKAGADDFFRGGCPTQLTGDELSRSLTSEPTFREATHAVLPPERELGKQIGPYRLLEKIGEGGGGSVFLAEQERPVRRQVALKVLRLGTDTQSVIARFEAERQVLAMMEHAHIAQVLDAGATDDGLPYFVMELVRGVIITEYCDAHRLDIPRRLELFIQVCQAIQHAHQKGVIHRDIKPSNILIATQDGAPVPKVIDFGVAKAMAGPLPADRTVQTLCDQLVGTPAYMSPEQAGAGGADVDARGDIYSLGVLLYELLVGQQPFTRDELQGGGLEEMLRTLREREPPRPSARLMALEDAERAKITGCRRVETRRLKALLDGDLDWVVMTALEKDRDRRYQTAEGLAKDVGHYLKHEPVWARPPSRWYRFGKLARRNKGVFASVAVVCIALLAGFGTSSWLYVRERALLREKAVLLREAESREKITRAAVMIRRGRMEDADALVGNITLPVIKPSIEAADVFRELGFWNVTQGRWPEAADRYMKLARADQVDEDDLSEFATRGVLGAAPTQVVAGELENYHLLARGTLARFAGTTSPVAAEQIIKINIIQPLDEEAKALLRPLVEVVRSAVSNAPDRTPEEEFLTAWRTFALAGLEYRLGNHAQAIAWGGRSLGYHDGSRTRAAMTHLILAMAHHRMGHAEAALDAFDAGSAAVLSFFPEGELTAIQDYGGRVSGRWYDWVNAYLLMGEAERLIHDTAPTSP